ncbi:MAG: NADAR family protein [Patescibacteria group bacterium]
MEKIVSPQVFSRFFSAFSAHPITYKDITYKTVEHAYHAQRYTDPKIVYDIVDSQTPEQAWEASQRHKAFQIPDFNERKLAVMEELFRAKLNQHADVRQALFDSGDALIVKHEPKDSWWGDGPDGSGRNEMGKLWMRLRDEFSEA